MSTPPVTPAINSAPQPLNALVTKVRTANPGAYDDMDDASLTKAVLAKYPQYSDLAAPPVPKPAAPNMQESGLAHALSPSDSVAGTGETNFVAENKDPTLQKGMIAEAAVGAGGAALAQGISAVPGIANALLSHAEAQAGAWAETYPHLIKLAGALGIPTSTAAVLGYLYHNAAKAGKGK